MEAEDLGGYTPIAETLIESSLWLRASHATVRVWITLVAIAWRPYSRGIAKLSLPALAIKARVTEDECKIAIDFLMAPDPESANSDEGGRRIIPLELDRPYVGGWRLISWPAYYAAFRRRNKAYAMRKARHATVDHGGRITPESGHACQDVDPFSPPPSPSPSPSPKEGGRERFAPPTLENLREYGKEIPGLNAEAFFDFYASKGWKIGSSMMKDWRAAARRWRRRDAEEGKVPAGTSQASTSARTQEATRSLEEAEKRVREELAESIALRKAHGLPV
jgi:hypothetical protein